MNNSSEIAWFLNIDHTPFDKVRIFRIDERGIVDTLCVQGFNLPAKYFLEDKSSVNCQITLEQNHSYTLLIHVESTAYIFMPATLNTADQLLKKNQKKNLFIYSLISVILVSFFINLVSYFQTKEKAYLLLGLALFFFLISFGYQHGLEMIPSLPTFLKTRMRTLFFGLTLIFFTLFTFQYLETGRSGKIHLLLKGLLWVCTSYTILILIPVLPLPLLNLITPYINLLAYLVFTLSGIYFVAKGVKYSTFYLLFTTGILVSAIIWALHLNNNLPENLVPGFLGMLAILTLTLLINLGLSDKIGQWKLEQIKSIHSNEMNRKLQQELEERKLVESDLRESNEKFRLLFNLIPQPVFLTELESGKILECNEASNEIFGFPDDELIGNTSTELNLISKAQRNDLIHILKKQQEIKSFEITIPAKNNELLSFIISGKIINIQNESNVLWVFTDITDLKKGQHEIRKLGSAIDKTANSVIITNANGEIDYVNEYFTKITGYEATEVMGKNPRFLKSGFHPSAFYKEIWNRLKNGSTWQGELLNAKKNGELFWEATTITPLLDDLGITTHYIAIKQDVTEQKRQLEMIKQSELKLRELNASKDKFFSIIGHDLLDPFNALYGFTNILVEELHQDNLEESREFAAYIQQSVQRILSLLQNLLIWSKSQSLEQNFSPGLTNIREIVDNMVSVLQPTARNKGIQFDLQVDPEIEVFMDVNMISTVVRNLIANAIKFSQTGGKIILASNISGNNLVVSVIDNGRGIEEEHLGQLFQLEKTFTSRGTNNEAGTGLGLVICKEFIEYHKGKIWVESQVGKGTTVHFTIPLHPGLLS
jgi:PAS domain S-box-containing protein